VAELPVTVGPAEGTIGLTGCVAGVDVHPTASSVNTSDAERTSICVLLIQ
jgi:hypothetical protein